MLLWRRYWTVTLLWALGAAVLSTLHYIWTNLTGPYAHGWFGAWASLRVLPVNLALFVPLTAFAGATAAARIAVGSDVRDVVSRAALCVACGLATFWLIAYVAPWLEGLVMHLALEGSGLPDAAFQAQSRTYWHDGYVQMLGAAQRSTASGTPDAAVELGVAYVAGLSYYLPLVAGVVGALVTAIGLLVGARTRKLGRLVVARAHQWGVALVLTAGLAGSFRAARLLSGHHAVPPEVTAPLVALVPALLLLALLWTEVVSRYTASRVPGTPNDR